MTKDDNVYQPPFSQYLHNPYTDWQAWHAMDNARLIQPRSFFKQQTLKESAWITQQKNAALLSQMMPNLLQDWQAWQAVTNKPCEEKMTRTTTIWNVLVSHFAGKKLVIDLDTTIIAATEQAATLKAAPLFIQQDGVDYLIDCQSIVTYEIPSGD